MKNYIVSEEELKAIFNGEKPRFDVFKPVEKIFDNKFHYGEFIGDSEKKKYADFDNELSIRNNKYIQIYINEL